MQALQGKVSGVPRGPRSTRPQGGGAKVRLFRTSVCLVVIVAIAAGAAAAQEVAGSQLSGVVRDSSNAGVPGAEVTVTKTDTGLTRTVFTGAEGAYAIPNLPVGPYQLK